MTENEGININSTPASRWAADYRKRYGYNFYGFILFIGVIITLFGGFIVGIPCIIVGGILLIAHHDHYNKLAKSNSDSN